MIYKYTMILLGLGILLGTSFETDTPKVSIYKKVQNEKQR